MRFFVPWVFFLTSIALFVGCGRETNAPSAAAGDATPVAFNRSGAPTVEFSVPDMMCPQSCAVAVKKILSQQPGAKEVYVDFDAKTAIVAVEPGRFDPQQAVAALQDRRFDHSA